MGSGRTGPTAYNMAWTKRLIGSGPGYTEWWHYNHEDGQIVIKKVFDDEPVVEQNKAMQAMIDERAGWKGNWHKVAHIPPSKYMEWWKKTNRFKDQKALGRLLNDPDNKWCRFRSGRV